MKFSNAVSSREWGMLLAGGLIASAVWLAAFWKSPVAAPTKAVSVEAARSYDQANAKTPKQVSAIDIDAHARPAVSNATSAIAAPAGFTAQSVQIPGPPRPATDYEGVSIEELRALAQRGDTGAMVALAELLMDPASGGSELNQGYILLDDAMARGSTEAAMALGESQMTLAFRLNPEIQEDRLYSFREAAAANYITALLMGDLRAVEGVQAVLPSNVTSVDVATMLRLGYAGYQQMLERRAELGLPPFSAHIPPYKWTPEMRALYEATRRP